MEKLKNLKFKALWLGIPFLALALSACQSSDQDKPKDKSESEVAQTQVTASTNEPIIEVEADALDHPIFNGRVIYLRGEMNDYGVQRAYRLRKNAENQYCALAPLRSDWSPYKFKFADANWTKGSNFGFAVPPGVLRAGSGKLLLNPKSRFEEIRYEVDSDGIYRFCISIDHDLPYVTVDLLQDGKLTTTEELIKAEIEREFSVPTK